VLFFEGTGVRWRLERHASARRVISVDVGSEEPEVLQFSKATRDLGRIEHVAAVGNVRGELGHDRGGIERQPVAEPPARQVGHGSHRQEIPAYARAVDDNEGRPPSRQHGRVRLGKRTDPDRDLLELDEQSFQRVAKLPLDTRPRLREVHRLRYDPHAFQLGGHVGWDQVAADREEAAQLRERGAQLFEGVA
jgi:hypothetical protein